MEIQYSLSQWFGISPIDSDKMEFYDTMFFYNKYVMDMNAKVPDSTGSGIDLGSLIQ